MRFPLEFAAAVFVGLTVPVDIVEPAVVPAGLTVLLDAAEVIAVEDGAILGSTPSDCPSCLLSANPILAFV